MFYSKHFNNKGLKLINPDKTTPKVPFHSLIAISNKGVEIKMDIYKGKKILIANVASNCGYTNQYPELEKLFQENKDNLIILGFPANDFKKQEEGNDEQIERFCKINYGITFPLFKKQSVLRPNQNHIYQWLTDNNQNGWNELEPTWNFCKYVIDEEGTLQAVFGPAISPNHKLFKKTVGLN